MLSSCPDKNKIKKTRVRVRVRVFVIVREEPMVNKAIHWTIHYTHPILITHFVLLFTSEVCGCDK